jgi:hypothetical protein
MHHNDVPGRKILIMAMPFKDIQISGVLRERCYAIQGTITRVYFQLSPIPPLGWSFMFTGVWQSTVYPVKRPAGIEAEALWIECIPEEIGQYHLEELEKALAQTNDRFRRELLEGNQARREKAQMRRRVETQLDELGTALNLSKPFPAQTRRSRSIGGRLKSLADPLAKIWKSFATR